MRFLTYLLFITVTLASCGRAPVYTVSGEARNEVDDRLFGGFFEKATWGGEIGSDAAISLRTREVMPEVREFMTWMELPLLRYPGGTAIDYYPWWRLIDSMPGEHDSRPYNTHHNPEEIGDGGIVSSDGRMGLHEFIALCRELDIEPLLVVNLGDGFYEKRSMEEAARRLGADFVRYCNATSGPMAELRAANGSPKPFNVKYWQVGNETWLFEGMRKQQRTPENQARYTEAVATYVNAMVEADPSIELISDGVDGIGHEAERRVGEHIDYFTFHHYSPWGIGKITQDGQDMDGALVPAEQVWRALAAAPKIDPKTGLSIIDNYPIDNVDGPLAMTEWNLNTWFNGDAKPAQPDNRLLAYGLGAGSYLNAILRVSDRVKIANQSMLVGTGWDITGIRVDTTEAERPKVYPTSLVTGLYSREHGDRLLEYEVANARFFEQPLGMSGIRPAGRVAEQDVVVTEDNEHYYLHIVNRAYGGGARVLSFNMPGAVLAGTQFILGDRSYGTVLKTSENGLPLSGDNTGGETVLSERPLEGGNGRRYRVSVPERSVSVVKLRKG